MGATDALLLSDPAFAALDVLGAARAVAAAITKLGDVDLVIAGRNSTDDESGAFGPALARSLGWPQLTYVGKIAELDEGGKRIVAERHLEEQIETVEVAACRRLSRWSKTSTSRATPRCCGSSASPRSRSRSGARPSWG